MRPTKRFVFSQPASQRAAQVFLAAILFFLSCAAPSKAQSANGFRWFTPASDAATWAKIQNAFKNQLQPDAPKTDGSTVFAYKFLERVGIVDQSALVIVGHKTAKVPQKDDEGERFSSAFTFDLQSGAITEIGRADEMWHWKFKTLAQFQLDAPPDVAFTYLSCWECEPTEVFSMLHYDAADKKWALRDWQPDKMIWWTGQDGLVVDADILEGAEDTVSFACLYGMVGSRSGRESTVASRCREVTDIVGGKTVATDVTVVYSLDGAALKVKPVTNIQEVAGITSALCGQKRSNALCKLPAVSTYNSPQLTMLGMFPTATKNRRDTDCFRGFYGNVSMYSIVEKCGRPDAGGGNTIGFFEYRLDDGSTVTIHWTDMQHVLDVVQSDKSGKTKTLLASK